MLEQLQQETFAIGAIGSLLFEATRWVSFRTKDELPKYFYKLHYWVLSLVVIAVGGITAAVVSPESLLGTLAVGISAPAIVTQISRTIPKPLKLATRSSITEI